MEVVKYFTTEEAKEIVIEHKEKKAEEEEALVRAIAKCSKEGGIIPKGVKIYRMGQSIEKDNERFFTADEVAKAAKAIKDAKDAKAAKDVKDEMAAKAAKAAITQMKAILKLEVRVGDFIYHWKYPNSDMVEKEKECIKDGKGRMKGICCGLTGIQKGGNNPIIEITLPALYALVNVIDKNNNYICFYGDAPEINSCKHIAMHLCGKSTIQYKAEFVSLTPVPSEWCK